MKVIATDVSKKYNLRLKELHRIANPGEIFETTEDRFVYLNGNNPKGYVVVEWYQEPEIKVMEEMIMPEEVMPEPVMEEPVIEEPKVEEPVVEEKPKKKTTKKKTTKKKVSEEKPEN